MSDVVPFERPAPPTGPAKPQKSKFGDDDYLLKWCAEWRMARAQQQKNWAEHELATMWGTGPNAELDLEPLGEMHRLEYHLSMSEPRTILLACELLGICVTILAHEAEDPEATLAQGPVLETVRNIVASLEAMPCDMPIGDAARKRRKATAKRRAK